MKYIKILAVVLVVMMLAGCANAASGENSSTELSSKKDSEPAETVDGEPDNVTVQITDKSGKPLGAISRNGVATMTDYGILYTANVKGGIQYRIFDPESGIDTVLEELAEQSYEAAFARTELGGKIYTLAIQGNLLDGKDHPLLLVELDPQGESKTYTVNEKGFPYTAMCALDGRLLIIDHDQRDSLFDRVLEFDPEQTQFTEKLTYELKERDISLNGETLRGICSDGEHIYLLRIRADGKAGRLFLDTYDKEFHRLSEQEITSTLKKGAENVGLVPEDTANELMQFTSRFAVIEGRYLYYENFSSTRFLCDLQVPDELFEADALFTASLGSGRICWFNLFGAQVYELRAGKLEDAACAEAFAPTDELWTLSFAPNGAGLAELVQNDPQTPGLTTRLVYLGKE